MTTAHIRFQQGIAELLRRTCLEPGSPDRIDPDAAAKGIQAVLRNPARYSPETVEGLTRQVICRVTPTYQAWTAMCFPDANAPHGIAGLAYERLEGSGRMLCVWVPGQPKVLERKMPERVLRCESFDCGVAVISHARHGADSPVEVGWVLLDEAAESGNGSVSPEWSRRVHVPNIAVTFDRCVSSSGLVAVSVKDRDGMTIVAEFNPSGPCVRTVLQERAKFVSIAYSGASTLHVLWEREESAGRLHYFAAENGDAKQLPLNGGRPEGDYFRVLGGVNGIPVFLCEHEGSANLYYGRSLVRTRVEKGLRTPVVTGDGERVWLAYNASDSPSTVVRRYGHVSFDETGISFKDVPMQLTDRRILAFPLGGEGDEAAVFVGDARQWWLDGEKMDGFDNVFFPTRAFCPVFAGKRGNYWHVYNGIEKLWTEGCHEPIFLMERDGVVTFVGRIGRRIIVWSRKLDT